MNHQGLGQRAIARKVRTSHTFVRKVIRSYNETNSSIGTTRANFTRPKIDTNVLEYIEVQKHMKPSTYASETQHRLLLDGVVHPDDLPGMSQINQRLFEHLLFSNKKLMVSSLEAKKPGALDQQNEYLQAISSYPARKLHFLMNQVLSKRRVIKSMDMLKLASELLKCRITHLTRHLQ